MASCFVGCSRILAHVYHFIVMSIASNGLSSGASAALAHASQVAPTSVQQSQSKGQYQLKRLRARHHLIIALAAQGMDQKEIAQRLQITEVTVSYTLNSDLGQQRLAVLLGEAEVDTIDLIKEFAELAPVALEVLEEILVNPAAKDADRKSIATDLLDRAGFGVKRELGVSLHLVDDEDIREAKILARKKGRAAGIIVDATIVDEDEDTE